MLQLRIPALAQVISPSDKQKLQPHEIQQFDNRWFAKREQLRKGYEFNFKQDIAPVWSIGQWMYALYILWEVTQDQKYIEELLALSKMALKYQDDELKRADDIRKLSLSAWSVKDPYYGNRRFAHMVHSAVLFYPMVSAARAILENKRLSSYKQQAKDIVLEAEMMVENFLPDYVSTKKKKYSVGYYIFPHELKGLDCTKVEKSRFHRCQQHKGWKGKPLPFNMNFGMTRVLVELYRINQNPIYKQMITEMQYYFVLNLKRYKHKKHELVKWNYMENYAKLEDISHGSLDMDLQVLLYRNRELFKDQITHLVPEYMQRFADTFVYKIGQSKYLSHFVDGSLSLKEKSSYSRSCDGWLDLAEFNSEILTICKRLMFLKTKDEKNPQWYLTALNYAKYLRNKNKAISDNDSTQEQKESQGKLHTAQLSLQQKGQKVLMSASSTHQGDTRFIWEIKDNKHALGWSRDHGKVRHCNAPVFRNPTCLIDPRIASGTYRVKVRNEKGVDVTSKTFYIKINQ